MPSPKFKERLGIPDFTDKEKPIWKCLIAEFLGNLLLNFFGCGSCINVPDPAAPADYVRIALSFGLVVFAGVQAFCHLSGGHLNPAVTLSFLITGRISVLKALLYVIVQCLGAMVGSAILKALTPDNHDIQGSLGLTLVNPKLSAVQGFGVEFFLGFVLVMVVFAVCDPNRPLVFIIGPLAIGLTVAMAHLTAIPLTGSSMNPARTLGAAVVVNIWTNHWVYWAGPIMGGMFAACIYQFLLAAHPPEGSSDYSPVRGEDTSRYPPKKTRSKDDKP